MTLRSSNTLPGMTTKDLRIPLSLVQLLKVKRQRTGKRLKDGVSGSAQLFLGVLSTLTSEPRKDENGTARPPKQG